MSQNALVIGGSRNIGYHAAVRLLASGSTVTFLLRSPSPAFDKDEVIQKYVESGKARLVQGDAMIREDVRRVWQDASSERPVDLLLFSVGFTGTPKFHLLKGFTISPANLVTQSLLNVLSELPKSSPQPKIITISTTGLNQSSRAAVPFLLKFVYSYLIAAALKDKVGAERVIAHCAGCEWKEKEPSPEIMGTSDWPKTEGLPPLGTLKSVLVVRPALLTDGECVADKKPKDANGPAYRVSENGLGGWTVSRKDVAHFIVDAALNDWEKYENKCVHIAY